MSNLKHAVGVFVVCALLLLLSACRGGQISEQDGWSPFDPARNLQVHLVYGRGSTAVSTVEAYFLPHPGEQDLSHSIWVSKIEADFGDGSGWQDLSHYYALDTTWQPLVVFNNTPIAHTYAEAGSYLLNARLTFWDGITTYLMNAQGLVQPETITVPYTT